MKYIPKATNEPDSPFHNDDLPNVDTIAAINAPTGGVKNVRMTCAVVLLCSSLGMF